MCRFPFAPDGARGCVTVLGISPLGQQIRSLTVAAPIGLPYVCSHLQSRDRKGAFAGSRLLTAVHRRTGERFVVC